MRRILALVAGLALASTALAQGTISQRPFMDPGNVPITGGKIDNTPIGATTPSTGAFTTINASSTITGQGSIEGVFITGGRSGTNDILTIAGQASASGPTWTCQNSLSNAYRPCSQIGTSHGFSINGGANTVSITSTGVAITGNVTTTTAGAQQGTATNDNAAAGKIGEYQEVKCLTATSGASLSFTSASPTVGTWASPPWTGNGGTIAFGNFACPFNITANAPTGLSTATNYWAVPIDATTFHVSTSAANAAAGTFANTSGSSSTANLTSNLAFSTTAGLATAVINLTAGDWDCSGSTIYTPGSTTSITNLQNGLNSASTTMGVLGTYSDFETAANIVTATNSPVYFTPEVRLSLASTTAEYLVSLNTFTASTLNGSGFIRCRRMR